MKVGFEVSAVGIIVVEEEPVAVTPVLLLRRADLSVGRRS